MAKTGFLAMAKTGLLSSATVLVSLLTCVENEAPRALRTKQTAAAPLWVNARWQHHVRHYDL